MRGHDGHERRMGRPQTFDADALSLQLSDAAHALIPEQFEAADMDAGEHDDRYAGVDCLDVIEGGGHAEMHVAAPDRRRNGIRRRVHIADVGKTLRAQQLFGDMLWGNTDRIDLREADGGGFEGPLRGLRWRNPDEAHGTGH